MTYRKEPIGSVSTDRGVIDDGWGIFRDDELVAAVDTETIADLLIGALTGKVQIVTENECGSEEPVLVTFDIVKATARYCEIIESADRKIPADVRVLSVRTIDGIERGEFAGDDVVRIGGEWYRVPDSYGDYVARLFELDLE